MSITELLGIQYPIIQGAMSQISSHELAAAVSEAGGLGVLASSGFTADELRSEIQQTKKITNKPFAVNVMLQLLHKDEIIDIIIEEGVKIITTGAGTPKHYIPRLKAAGIKIIPVVAAVKHAQKMEALGVDAIIAEGQEAGGHIGRTSSMALLPQIVDAVSIPVIGAGGVGDGRSVAAMFALGAQGVQAGTLFLTAEEAPIHSAYKEALLQADDLSTIVTGGRYSSPVRSLTNEMLVKYNELETANAPFEELEKLTAGSLTRAIKEGDTVSGSMMAGEIAGLLQNIRPAQQIIEELMDEARTVAQGLPGRLA